MASAVEVLPLGAGQDVGRSCCIVRMAGRTVMFDCGAHFGFRDARRFPEFGLLSRAGRFTELIDALVITHFHIDHIGALPYFTEVCGYRGPVLMTYPTFAMAPIMLEDYVKVNADRPGEVLPYTEQHVRDCLRRVTAVDLHQVVAVAPGLSFTFHYAGHVLGAAMVTMTAGHLTALYTGDFNSAPDRHLGSAELAAGGAGPAGCLMREPDVLISEATYAASLRDSKRGRERDLLQAVEDTVAAGGKVLIPTFAMGRAQELLMLLADCWRRKGLTVPIYFSSAMASRALTYYQLLLNWTNANVRKAVFGDSAGGGDGGGGAGGGGGGGEGGGGGTGSGVPGPQGEDREAEGSEEEGEGEEDEDGVEEEEVGCSGLGWGRLGERDGRSLEEESPAALRGDSGVGGQAAEGGGARPSSSRRPRGRRRPLPPDIGRQAAAEAAATQQPSVLGPCAGPAATPAPAAAPHVGVFSEADVYGMFRTRPWDRSLLQAPGPAVLFASPGNITSGVSLEAFRAWAGSSRNLVVLAGYQVRGTLGARLEGIGNQQQLSGGGNGGGSGGGRGGGGGGGQAATVDLPSGPGGSGRQEVRCRVKMLAFSAHADLRGLMGLVRRCRPRAVVLVHGQREPMEFLRGRIEATLGIECHAPPTGSTVTLHPRRDVPLGLRPQLLATAKCAAAALGAAHAAHLNAALAAAAHSRAFAPYPVGEMAVDGRNSSRGGGPGGDGDEAGGGSGLGSSPAAAAVADLCEALAASELRLAEALAAAEVPQPLTALPLSGVVVARVVAPPPLQPQLQEPQAAAAAGAAGAAPGTGGQTAAAAAAAAAAVASATAAATQLTLTDSTTAAKPLLQAHGRGRDGTQMHVAPYKITYGCTITVAHQQQQQQQQQQQAHAQNGAQVEAEAKAQASAQMAHHQQLSLLRRAQRAVCSALGGYVGSRHACVDGAGAAVCCGSFRAQLAGDADTHGSAADGAGGSVSGGSIDAGLAESGSTAAVLWQWQWACSWAAEEDVTAARCLQALRAEFGGDAQTT